MKMCMCVVLVYYTVSKHNLFTEKKHDVGERLPATGFYYVFNFNLDLNSLINYATFCLLCGTADD